MGRIKLNRPPPVSRLTVNSPQNIVSRSETEDVHVADIPAVSKKDSNDVNLTTGEHSSTTAEDKRAVVEHKHAVRIRHAQKERCTSASENVLQGSLVSDSSLKKRKKKKHHTGSSFVTQAPVPVSDDTEPNYAVQHAVASSGGHGCFYDESYALRPSQETIMHIEPQQSDTGVNDTRTNSLLDNVLKGFLAEKLAVIENERKSTNVDHKYDNVEAVVQSKPTPKLRRSKRSRENNEQQDLDFLPAKSRYTLPHHDNEYTKAHSDILYTKSRLVAPHAFLHSVHDHISYDSTTVEDVIKHSLSTGGSSFKRGHREHQHEHSLLAKRHFEKNKGQAEFRPQSFDLPQQERGQPDEHRSIDCLEQIHDHLPPPPPRTLCGSTAVEDGSRHSLSTECSSFKNGHRKNQYKHSSLAKRHLGKNEVQTEHILQSFNLPQLERNRSDERRSIDCLEQIRAFVSHSIPKFAQPIGQDHVPLQTCHQSNASKVPGRKRQKSGNRNKSGSTSSHHCRHHHHRHHKKQKCDENLAKVKKHSKRGIGKKSLQTTKNVQKGMLISQKHIKQKRRHHHRKNILPDRQDDYKKLNKDKTLPGVEATDKADAISKSKSRSLTPLGICHKHHESQKHKKKRKSCEETISQIFAENVPLLPEKIDTQYDKISSDEEFIPMKVQRNEDDVSKVLHKEEMPDADGVKQDHTNRKSAVELKSKFLKVTGKRPKRRMHLSDANSSAERPVSLENVQNSVSVGDHQGQDAVEHFQVAEDTVVDHDSTEDTMASSVTASHDYADQISTSHEVAISANSTSPEDVVSCCDKDDRNISQMMINEDDAANKVSETCQGFVKSATDEDNLTETSVSDKTLQLGENEHQETAVDNEKKTSTYDDSESSGKTVSADNVVEAVSEEELKTCPEEHAIGYVCKSKSNQSQTLTAPHSDNESDAVGEKTTEAEDKDRNEVTKTEEVSVVKDISQSSSDKQSVSDEFVAQVNQTASIEALPTCVTTSGEDSSTVNSAEKTSSSTADVKDSKSRTVEPGTLMGPPLALPPSITFKKPLPVMKMKLRITDTSADIISSGAKNSDRDKKPQDEENREEGNQLIMSVINYF